MPHFNLGSSGRWEIEIVNIKDQLQAQKIRQAYDRLISMREQIRSQKEQLTAVLEEKAEKK